MSSEGHRWVGLCRDQQVVVPEVHVEIFHLQRHRPVEEGVVIEEIFPAAARGPAAVSLRMRARSASCICHTPETRIDNADGRNVRQGNLLFNLAIGKAAGAIDEQCEMIVETVTRGTADGRGEWDIARSAERALATPGRTNPMDHTVSVGMDAGTLKQLDDLRRAHPNVPSRVQVIKSLIWEAHRKVAADAAVAEAA